MECCWVLWWQYIFLFLQNPNKRAPTSPWFCRQTFLQTFLSAFNYPQMSFSSLNSCTLITYKCSSSFEMSIEMLNGIRLNPSLMMIKNPTWVIGSFMTSTSVTVPNCPKYSLNLSWFVCHESPPTNSFPGAESELGVLLPLDSPWMNQFYITLAKEFGDIFVPP